jgi:hypothetical protein
MVFEKIIGKLTLAKTTRGTNSIFQKSFAKAARLQYSYSDSIACGNCEAGTRAFILRLQLNSNKKYRGFYLLNLAKEKSTSSVSFIQRMIKSKMK